MGCGVRCLDQHERRALAGFGLPQLTRDALDLALRNAGRTARAEAGNCDAALLAYLSSVATRSCEWPAIEPALTWGERLRFFLQPDIDPLASFRSRLPALLDALRACAGIVSDRETRKECGPNGAVLEARRNTQWATIEPRAVQDLRSLALAPHCLIHRIKPMSYERCLSHLDSQTAAFMRVILVLNIAAVDLGLHDEPHPGNLEPLVVAAMRVRRANGSQITARVAALAARMLAVLRTNDSAPLGSLFVTLPCGIASLTMRLAFDRMAANAIKERGPFARGCNNAEYWINLSRQYWGDTAARKLADQARGTEGRFYRALCDFALWGDRAAFAFADADAEESP
jgi:hypothetical protein